MDLSRVFLSAGGAWRLAVGLALALMLLTGCNRTDDFGRPYRFAALHDPPPEEKDKDKDKESDKDSTASVSGSRAAAPLTDDERQLRDLAQNLLAPAAPAAAPGLRFPGLAPKEPAAGGPEEQRKRYADYIARGPFRSVTSRYARLIDDTRGDIDRLEPFFHVARRVADLDAKRAQGLAHMRGLPPDERAGAERRMRENRMLAAEVHRTLSERVETYRLALERLVVAAPSPMAIDAERTRLDLERRLAGIGA